MVKKAANENALQTNMNETVLDEVKEIITLPQFSAKSTNPQSDIDGLQLESHVCEQLKDFVVNVSFMYRSNPCK